MMRARLVYAAKTLAGPWMALVVLGLDVAVSLQRGSPWRGEGLWTIEWFSIPLFIIWPVTAGFAAVDAARLSRPGNIHLICSGPRQASPYVRAALWCALPACVAHCLVVAVGLLIGQVTHPSAGWAMLALGLSVHCFSICWFAALGSAGGRFTIPLAAGLIGAAGGFTLIFMLGDATFGAHFRLLAVGGSIVSQIGVTYHVPYLACQLGILAVTGIAAVTLPLRPRGLWKLPHPAAYLSAASATALIVITASAVSMPRKAHESYPPTHCRGTAPKVCLYEENRRLAGPINRALQQLMNGARRAGYMSLIRAAVVQTSRGYKPTAENTYALEMSADWYERKPITRYYLAMALLEPLNCPNLYDATGTARPPEAHFNRLDSLVRTWVHLSGSGENLEFLPEEAKLLSAAQVADIQADFARCDLGGSG